MTGAWRTLVVLALAGIAQAGAAQAAVAATATGRPASFVAAPGERNDLTVGSVPGTTLGAGGLVAIERVTFSDAGAPISAGVWCLPLPLGEAQCDPEGVQNGGAYGYQGPEIQLGDLDDRARLGTLPRSGRPTSAFVDGGSGDDVIDAGSALATLDGGDGNDTLIGGLLMSGGAGADLLRGTPAQFDWASYADHGAKGVDVTLDAKANDGNAGEGDDARTRNVRGSGGADVITGNASANRLEGAIGNDVLDGGGGDDELSGEEGADRLVGGDGDDLVDATYLSSGLLGVADRADTVTCGAGADRVTADAIDRVAADCEVLEAGFSTSVTLASATRLGSTGRAGFVLRLVAPATAAATRGALRLLDATGLPVSSRARFTLSKASPVARLRLRVNAATRRRLARSRSGAISLIAERTSRPTDLASPGYERINTRVRLRRPSRR